MTDPMQAALTDDIVRLTEERDSLADQVSQLAARLAEEQIRNGELEEKVGRLRESVTTMAEQLVDRNHQLTCSELEREMAYHAYEQLRSEHLALTFEPTGYPATPQLDETFPEASDNS